jgi:hypothetical protein
MRLPPNFGANLHLQKNTTEYKHWRNPQKSAPYFTHLPQIVAECYLLYPYPPAHKKIPASDQILRISRQALCPPNPKLLLIATFTRRSRALFGT